jgi:hypothetical protein
MHTVPVCGRLNSAKTVIHYLGISARMANARHVVVKNYEPRQSPEERGLENTTQRAKTDILWCLATSKETLGNALLAIVMANAHVNARLAQNLLFVSKIGWYVPPVTY